MRSSSTRAGFTLIELAAATAVTAAGAAALVVSMQPPATPPAPGPAPASPSASDPKAPGSAPKAGQPAGGGDLTAALAASRAKARQQKDVDQIRAITQAMIIFAQGNQDLYPLPSLVDANNTTVSEKGAAKDTTANILSILVFNGSISTNILFSPAEANANIEIDQDYQFSDPKAAAMPAKALWDPALSADFTGGKKGNISYAHQQPAGPRKPMWSNTFSTSEACVANRGPEIASVTAGADGAQTAKMKDPNSLTLLIHGPRDSWEGNVSYNDGHVNFETVLVPAKPGANKDWPTYVGKEGKSLYDCLLFDEADAAEGKNQFLGIFTKAGEKVSDFKAIWD